MRYSSSRSGGFRSIAWALITIRKCGREQYNFGMYYLNSIKRTVISTALRDSGICAGSLWIHEDQMEGQRSVVPDLSGNHDDPAAGYDRQPFRDHAENGTLQHPHGIILMTMFSLYGVFLLRQAMMGIPDSLCESAKIDGAGHLRIFSRLYFR